MRVRFSEFVYDDEARQLSRGDTAVHLSQRAFRLLGLVLCAAPAAVAKDDIYRALWGETFVAEANIPNIVSELRSALGDDPRKPRFLTTVHRFGYRFDGALTTGDVTVPTTSRYLLAWGDREFPLSRGTHTMGRESAADVTIESQGISRRHALLHVSDTAVLVEDLGSKNGTFVGGTRITEKTAVQDGESIRLGSAWLVLHRLTDDASTETEIV